MFMKLRPSWCYRDTIWRQFPWPCPRSWPRLAVILQARLSPHGRWMQVVKSQIIQYQLLVLDLMSLTQDTIRINMCIYSLSRLIPRFVMFAFGEVRYSICFVWCCAASYGPLWNCHIKSSTSLEVWTTDRHLFELHAAPVNIVFDGLFKEHAILVSDGVHPVQDSGTGWKDVSKRFVVPLRQ